MINKLLLSILTSSMLMVSTAYAGELIGKPIEFSTKHKNGDSFMSVKLSGTLNLSSTPLKGYSTNELSALAWSEDEQILYALSDKGYILYLRPVFNDRLLSNIEFVDAYALKDKGGDKLVYDEIDAEGMDIVNGNNQIKGDDELMISFELRPRIIRYDTHGNELEKYTLPKTISNVKRFDFRNSALESLVIHPEHGILTAPQLALRADPQNLRSIHDLKGNAWYFKPATKENSSTTDLAIANDGSVLILERKYSTIFSPILTVIRQVQLDQISETKQPLETKTLAIFDSSKGWKIDNFEGLTHHRDNYYFLISDNNQNFFQRTLLIYFEVIE